jgi:hypothetical protein
MYFTIVTNATKIVYNYNSTVPTVLNRLHSVQGTNTQHFHPLPEHSPDCRVHGQPGKGDLRVFFPLDW